MEKRARGVAALLGLALAVAWMFGWGYGASGWMVWTDFAAAVVIFAGLGPAAMDDEPGVATWPLVGLVLMAVWMFGLAVGATAWLTWLSFGLGCAFLLLTIGFTLASGDVVLALLHRRHRVHG
jgi:hypothetical protein